MGRKRKKLLTLKGYQEWLVSEYQRMIIKFLWKEQSPKAQIRKKLIFQNTCVGFYTTPLFPIIIF